MFIMSDCYNNSTIVVVTKSYFYSALSLVATSEAQSTFSEQNNKDYDDDDDITTAEIKSQIRSTTFVNSLNRYSFTCFYFMFSLCCVCSFFDMFVLFQYYCE